jgi:hypothetical protein
MTSTPQPPLRTEVSTSEPAKEPPKASGSPSYLKGVAIAVSLIVIGLLAYHFWPRDTWERDNAPLLASAKAQAESAFAKGNYDSSFIKCEEIVSLVGHRKLNDPALQDILGYAVKNKTDCSNKIIELRTRQEKEANRKAEEERRKAEEDQRQAEAQKLTQEKAAQRFQKVRGLSLRSAEAKVYAKSLQSKFNSEVDLAVQLGTFDGNKEKYRKENDDVKAALGKALAALDELIEEMQKEPVLKDLFMQEVEKDILRDPTVPDSVKREILAH